MIKSLTKQQEFKFKQYVDKWKTIGLSTDRITLEQCKPIVDRFYKKILKKETVPIIIMDSPIGAWLATLYVACLFGKESQVGAQVGAQVKNFIWPYVSGNLWSGWFSFYDFMFSAVIKLETPLFTDLKEMSKLHLVYPLDQACVLSQKPIEINMTNGLLHKDGAPSIKYADGFSVWSLHGVRVPQELAETPTEKLSMEFFKKETNADIRAEFIRKFGIQRMVSLGRVVDSVTEESQT